MSEVRVAFVFIAIVVAYLGYTALTSEDRKRANICVYGSVLISVLLFISAFCDASEISASKSDNENLCGLKGAFNIPSKVQLVHFTCSHSQYYLTIVLTSVSGVSMVYGIYERLDVDGTFC